MTKRYWANGLDGNEESYYVCKYVRTLEGKEMVEFKDPREYALHLKLEAGCSYKEIEEDSGISAGSLSDIFKSKVRLPRWDTFARILSALDGDLATGRALWLKAKVNQNLADSDFSADSELVFCDVLINVIADVFQENGYSVEIARDFKCPTGKRWDIAFNFKKAKNHETK